MAVTVSEGIPLSQAKNTVSNLRVKGTVNLIVLSVVMQGSLLVLTVVITQTREEANSYNATVSVSLRCTTD